MAFKKTFNRSERAALLALGELFKQGIVDEDVFDFQTMTCGRVVVCRFGVPSDDWLTREVVFRKNDLTTLVLVGTRTGQGYSEEHPNETISWEPKQALLAKLGGMQEFVRTSSRNRWRPGSWR